MGRRASASASRPSKQARFIAIEKRITTWHREAPVLTMPVTCHHRFELCRRALSSKLADSIPPPLLTYVLPPALACGPAGSQWTPHSTLHFESNWLYLQPARFSLKDRTCRLSDVHAGYLSCHYMGLCTVRMTITRVDYPKRVSPMWRIISECSKRLNREFASRHPSFSPICCRWRHAILHFTLKDNKKR